MNKLVAIVAGVVAVAAGVAGCGEDSGLNVVPANTMESGTEKSFFEYSAATGNIEPVSEPIPVTPKLLKHGEWVFRGMCIGCHGVDGDGNGAVWELGDKYAREHKLPRKPRNFTDAVFKVRSTPSGSLPTDVDLFKSISRGLVADQDMPAFKYLPERDRWAVVAYIKSFSDIWEEEKDLQEDPIEIGRPLVPDAAMLLAGKQVYAEMKCAKCHGPLGKGDGPSAPELTDDNKLPIVPRDFSDKTQFVGGADPRSVFQTFNTGLDGTPMPGFRDFLNEEQSWQLVWYVTSLRTDFDLNAERAKVQLARGEPVTMAAAAPTTPAAQPAQAKQESKEAEPKQAEPGKAEDTADAAEKTDVAQAAGSDAATGGAAPKAEAKADAKTAAASPGSAPKFLGKYKEVPVSDGGAIQGKVVFNGSVKLRTVLPTKDKSVCGKKRKVPTVIVGEGGAVKDTVVFLKGVTQGKAWPEMTLKAPILDQKNCQFEPHVQVGRQGTIDIINSDPVLHNTHGYYGSKTAFNVALPRKDQKVSKILKRAGTVKVDCDAHGWMLAWIQVVDSPYFFQTKEDGSFSITDVPAGEYTLVVWQEKLGEKEFPVTVTAGATVELPVDLTN